jgi:hypothetical protein
MCAVWVAKVLSDGGHAIDHGDQGAVDYLGGRVCHLDLKLPASQTEHIVKALSYGSRIGVGEGHATAPWALL